MSYIQVSALQKTFTLRKKRPHSFIRDKETVHALTDVSFSIEKGELVGYIGPNGAGKSTTVKILSGILTPDGGMATVGGRIPWKERKEHVRHIGVVFGQRTQLWWDVSPLDSYSLLKDIYRIPESSYKNRLEELTEALDIAAFIRTPLRQLSLGQRMRAELCASLLHSPELLFLDEPTIGLDAVSKLKLREFLLAENARNKTTILLTTHDMDDIQELCSRVCVLGHGKLLYDGKLDQLLSRYDTSRTLSVRYGTPVKLGSLPLGCSVHADDGAYRISYDPARVSMQQLLPILQEAGPIQEMNAGRQSVDHMIARMYEEMQL
ncbi:MAG: ATP-binding cassette domain-containing protein [Clostridiales bacterium]|nr:ATP-binding cassette domain-containing protein [Clostridiales bacterium]